MGRYWEVGEEPNVTEWIPPLVCFSGLKELVVRTEENGEIISLLRDRLLIVRLKLCAPMHPILVGVSYLILIVSFYHIILMAVSTLGHTPSAIFIPSVTTQRSIV